MARKSRRTRRRGGAVIGEGMTGAVFYPALSCADPSQNLVGNYVTKRVTKKVADREMAISSKLREVKPDYAIYPESVCPDGEGKYLLFSRYGGTSLTGYASRLERAAFATPPTPIDMPTYTAIQTALRALIPGIEDLNRRGVFHNDITFDNIVYNSEDGKAYLIDFERSGPTQTTPDDDKTNLIELIATLKAFKDFSYGKPIPRGPIVPLPVTMADIQEGGKTRRRRRRSSKWMSGKPVYS